MRYLACTDLLVILMVCSGCGGASRSPYDATAGASPRNIPEGERLFQLGVVEMSKNPEKAEKLLMQALAADLYHGAAHNDLGVIYLKQGKLYEAATEFTWACKLLPGYPDPHVNLALVLDRGGKSADAVITCKTALEIRPGYLPALEEATLIQLRDHLVDDTIIDHLGQIAEQESDESWRQWALGQRDKIRMRPTP